MQQPGSHVEVSSVQALATATADVPWMLACNRGGEVANNCGPQPASHPRRHHTEQKQAVPTEPCPNCKFKTNVVTVVSQLSFEVICCASVKNWNRNAGGDDVCHFQYRAFENSGMP